jgi:hypothetical protein
MQTQSCCPYRGYGIFVQIAEVESPSFNGTERRFAMSWSIEKEGSPTNSIAIFPEPLKFMSASEALRYAEGRAHTFIDSTLACAAVE